MMTMRPTMRPMARLAASAAATALSLCAMDDGFAKLAEVNNTEIKLTLRADQIDLATHTFHLDKSAAERRWMTFYDSKSLALYNSGLILRSRKVKDGTDDSTTKLLGLDATKIAPSWLTMSGFKCEVDRDGARAVSFNVRQLTLGDFVV